ncbi:hypothetical protein VTL71DRAFT_9813 [Oculimacula yallundae]|uniref:Uncharacterized protein n=1 Tax=Oculimacula yallundae TaxID=86028 RepID=A0ABR4BRY4_9HELO
MSQVALGRGTLGQPKGPSKVTPRPLCPNLARQDSKALRSAAYFSTSRVTIGFPDQEPCFASPAWIRLTCSPHRADTLRVEPYLVEHGRSVMLRAAELLVPRPLAPRIPPSHSSSPRSSNTSSAMAPSPRTPVRQQGRINGDQSDSPSDRASTCITPDTPPPPPKDTPRPKKVSALEKDLPAKPILRHASPERPGLLDATDSAAKRMTVDYPPLKPSNVSRHRPTMSDTSFEVTPSLRSVRDSTNFEIGTASTKTSLKVQGLPVTITSQRTLHPASSGIPVPGARASGSGPISTRPRRVASLSHGGHIGAYKNGSPIQRYPSSPKAVTKTPIKFNRRKARDFQVLPDSSPDDGLKVKVKVDVKQTEENLDASEDTLIDDSILEIPAQSDTDRRYTKLGVGPTVRYSKDAREVLMGKSPNVKNVLKNASHIGTSSSVKLLNDSPYPLIPKKQVKEVKSKFQANDVSASRVTRPTASSAARTQDTKAMVENRKSFMPSEMKKATELKKSPTIKRSQDVKKRSEIKKGPEVKKVSKGIRSRVSDLLHGRRRTSQPLVNKSPAPSICKTSKTQAKKVVEVINTDEPSDRMHSDSDQREVQAHSGATLAAHTTPAAVRRRRRAAFNFPGTPDDNDDDDQPPPPPRNSVEDLRAHYLEDGASHQTDDERLVTTIGRMQTALDQIMAISATHVGQYPGFRIVIEPIIQSLGTSIVSAQNARVAVMQLDNARLRVMADTLIMSEAIGRAADQARNMLEDIEDMIPDADVAV